MFNLNKIYVAVLLYVLVIVSAAEEALQVTEVEQNTIDTNPAKMAVLTQLNITRSVTGGAIFTYKCTVGTPSSNRLVCAARDSASWPSAHNVELKLRCPRSGSGVTLSYVEIIYSVSSPSVNCFVNEGALASGHIGITVQAWNTFLFSYSANFFSI